MNRNDNEQLRVTNSRLETIVQELKLEISFYKGEAKRLEWEKEMLNQDIKRMSSLFKTWVDELQSCHTTRNLADESEQFNAMVKYPCKSISDLLQLSDKLLFVTSSQPPHFIEYVNTKWCMNVGWNASEILGYTCAFMQGSLTDKKGTDAFMRDLKETGYARMHVYNYMKNGIVFEVNVTVFPVFDSVLPDSDVAVLTHFAGVLTEMKPFPDGIRGGRKSETTSLDGSEKTSTESANSTSHPSSSNNGSHVGMIVDQPDSSKSAQSSNNDTSFSSSNQMMSSNNSDTHMSSNNSESNLYSSGRSDPNNANTTSASSSSRDNSSSSNENMKNDNASSPSSGSGSSNNGDHEGHRCEQEHTYPEKPSTKNHHHHQQQQQHHHHKQAKQSHLSKNDASNPDLSGDNSDTSSNSGDMNGNNSGNETTSNQGSENSNYDRRSQSKRFEPKCVISEESFYNFGHSLRLSNLLRLMLSCNNAMVLTNRLGQVIHVNTAWCRLTGYELSEVEGKTCRFLHGPETNPELIALAKEDLLNDKSHQMIVMNYRKNGEKFINKVIMVPIHGGYLDASITHYCGLLLPQEKNVKNEMNQQQPHHGGGVEIILNSLPVTSAALNVPPSIVQPTANNNNNNGKAGSSDTTSVTSSNSGSSSGQQQNGSQNGSNSSSNDSNNSGSNRNSSSGSSSNNNVNSSSTSSSSQLKQKLEQVDITEAMFVEPPHKKMKM